MKAKSALVEYFLQRVQLTMLQIDRFASNIQSLNVENLLNSIHKVIFTTFCEGCRQSLGKDTFRLIRFSVNNITGLKLSLRVLKHTY